MLVLNDICKTYEGRTKICVLDGVSFEVNRGEVLAMLGPNGSGKTTLLKILAGIEHPSQGAVRRKDKRPHLETRSGIVFQNYRDSLFPWLTVKKNIEIAANSKQEVSQILKHLALENHKDKFPYELSGGLAQLVAFGRALATNPELLLLDEPFAALDYHSTLALAERFNELWEEKKLPAVLVTHSPEEALFLADRIIILSRSLGRIINILENTLPRPRLKEHLRGQEAHLIRTQILESVHGLLV